MLHRTRVVAAPAILLLIIGVVAVLAMPMRPMEPLDVVGQWTEARNAGDVDAAMGQLADGAMIFGISTVRTDGLARLRAIFEAQAIAGHRVEDDDCSAEGPRVICRYLQEDAFMRKCGLSLTGEHQYLVYAGKLAAAERTHDNTSRDVVYASLAAFRQWVERTHPGLEAAIWSDSNSAFYTTVDGARSMLAILDAYDC
jgi:hypothetical protein